MKVVLVLSFTHTYRLKIKFRTHPICFNIIFQTFSYEVCAAFRKIIIIWFVPESIGISNYQNALLFYHPFCIFDFSI